jgi:hypothetical protein
MRLIAAALAAALLAAPAHAAIVFSDNFDAENGGASALNYASFANWTVSGGTVDLIAHPGLACRGGAGSCVDLDGSTGDAGVLTLNGMISFDAGDEVDIRFWLSGNQRGGSDEVNIIVSLAAPTDLTDSSVLINGVLIPLGGGLDVSTFDFGDILASSAPYALWGVSFTAAEAGSFGLSIANLGGDNVGAVLDDVSISVTPDDPGDVPAPAALALFGLGLAAIGAARRR